MDERGTWVTYIDERPATRVYRKLRVTVVRGKDVGKSFDFERDEVRIGARPPVDLVLKDPKVSGLHASLKAEGTGYRLRDLGSTNGTFLGGVRVFDAIVPSGATVQLGDTELRLVTLEDTVEVPLAEETSFGELVGQSAPMRELFARMGKVAQADATVLVTGETGVGKERVALALHERSPRAKAPLVVVDCGSLPETLIESELFGHEKGAFTGADTARAGAFERAQGGTVFLDEVGELPTALQPKLLRVLERRRVRRLGGGQELEVDVRVIAATHRDLQAEVAKGWFREDLYFRLAVVVLDVPPLRERKDDLPLLVRHLLRQLPGGERTIVSDELLTHLARHDWPGNVRELRNLLERALALGEPPVPASSSQVAPRAKAGQRELTIPIEPERPFKTAKQDVIDAFERAFITQLLQAHGGNVTAAARATGIDRMSLHKILSRLGIDPRPRYG